MMKKKEKLYLKKVEQKMKILSINTANKQSDITVLNNDKLFTKK